MNLSDFLNVLYKTCGNGDLPANFLIRIFTKLTTEQENDFFDKSNDYLKRIFNGTKQIKQSNISYLLTHIDKDTFDSYLFNLLSDDSLLELAYDFEKYVGNATTENITQKVADLFVFILKQQLNKKNSKQNENKTSFNNENMYEEIDDIIRSINKLTEKEMEDIQKYEASRVNKKINNDNATLKKEIKYNVVDYYSYIEKMFAESDNSNLFFNFSNQVRERFEKYDKDGLPQEMIFDSMCDWLKERTQSKSQNACRIMISFFVQNCEVFNEIS